jgi:hypothetical protein
MSILRLNYYIQLGLHFTCFYLNNLMYYIMSVCLCAHYLNYALSKFKFVYHVLNGRDFGKKKACGRA